MNGAERTLADRARRLLRARGGRADEAALLAGLFGAQADPARWGALLGPLLEPLPDVRRTPDGAWELTSAGSPSGDVLIERSYVALATAVTSADPWHARLVMLAAVRVQHGRAGAIFETIFNPRCRLPRYLVAATGLSQAAVEEAPSFADVLDELLDFLGEDPLVGVEIHDQVEALGHELSRLDRPGLANPRLDLAHLAARLGVRPGKANLPTLAAALGLTHPRPYHPPADARVAARLANLLLVRAAAAGWRDLTSLSPPSTPPPSAALRRPDPPEAPDGPGVYLLQDGAGQVLYVGKARRLRSRLAAYHRRQLGLLRRLEGLAAAVERVETIPTTSELEALLLEARLLRRHQPPFNTQRRTRRPALFLQADLTEEGAGLAVCAELGGDGARYLGPFRTASGAAATLRLARELFPGLRGRARAAAPVRRPLVQAALRFLTGQKHEVLERLRAEQRRLAAAGDQVALGASRALLRRAIDFSLDAAAVCAHPLADRLLVLSPLADGRLLVHLIEGGRLLAVYEAADVDEARERAAGVLEEGLGVGSGPDEPNLIFRWLCGLGPEHRVERLSGRLG